MTPILRRFLLIGALLLVSVGSAHGAIYVANPPFGDDGSGDGSPTAPYETIQNAYDEASSQGETIIVAPGVFNECVNATGQTVETNPGVFQEKWVKIRANHPNPSLTTINGNGSCTTVVIGGLAGEVDGFTITGGGDSAIKAYGSVRIVDNIIDQNSGNDGGGIRYESSTCQHGQGNVEITGNTLTGNSALADGGAISIHAGNSPTVTCQADNVFVTVANNTIENNHANDDGGGLDVTTESVGSFAAVVTVEGNTIRGNIANFSGPCCSDGGGIRAQTEGDNTEQIFIRNNVVEQNSTTSDGGGIDVYIDASNVARHLILVDNNIVDQNVSAQDGGGIAAALDTVTLATGQRYEMLVTNNTVTDNVSGGGGFGGGGILARYYSESSLISDAQAGRFLISHNRITGNQTSLVGAGISASAEANLEDSEAGGCLPLVQDASARIDIQNNLIAHNIADNPFPGARGGGVAAIAQACDSGGTSSSIDLLLNTIANNETTLSSGGVEVAFFSLDGAPTSVNLSHNVIADNEGIGVGGATPSGNWALTLDHNNVVLNYSGNYSAWLSNPTGVDGNITALPHFMDPPGDDYRLTFISPMIDAGQRMRGGLPLVDFEGGLRIFDGDDDGIHIVDLGYDEYFVCNDVDRDSYGDPLLTGDQCSQDNCPTDFNPAQSDCDMDLIGDACDPDTVDADADGVDQACDINDFFPLTCIDLDEDGCDDCTTGVADPFNDGPDGDSDGICDAGDDDDDDDGALDGDDSSPLDPFVCSDLDTDGCDDCAVGLFDPLADGQDSDSDGLCDDGGADSDPFDPLVCRDVDADGCDDCSGGSEDASNDGLDTDSDGLCDAGDADDDNDGVDDVEDSDPLSEFACRDLDSDGCDDCSGGTDDVSNDGLDTDSDGLCDVGDPDDDGDGVEDGEDADPLDPLVCEDSDFDGCDDCSAGQPAVPFALLDEQFEIDAGGLSYVDDTFRGTAQPDYASGTHDPAGGETGGGLVVSLGGVDDTFIADMSGGWVHTFNLASEGEISIEFSYNLTIDGGFEPDETAEVLFSLDGALIGNAPDDFIAALTGDGNGGPDESTGWQLFQTDLGLLAAGDHTIVIGGYLTQKTLTGELATIRIDDVLLTRGVPEGFSDPANDGLDTDSDGLCDAGDADDDNDGVDDGDDSAPLDPFQCRDFDGDGCEDCSSGQSDLDNDGPDNDSDGICDPGDADDDNDGVDDGDDSAPLDGNVCRDLDADGCDDCSSGSDDVANDGLDTDADGQCNVGDLDDDGDGFDDIEDSDPLDPLACADSDADSCDDCSQGQAQGGSTILDEDFEAGPGALVYADDSFRGTAEPLYADGIHDPAGGLTGGGLVVALGGVDEADIVDMSGGWAHTFNLPQEGEVSIEFRYNLTISGEFEADEATQLLLAVDGVLVGTDPDDFIVELFGEGTAGPDISSGWQLFQADLGLLPAGDHTVVVGGYLSKKTTVSESSTIRIDDLLLTGPSGAYGANPANDGLDTDADGACDAGDPDDDNDGVDDGDDSAPLDANVCRDLDADGCDDCSSGSDDPANDGLDSDLDGQCDVGDLDDDNDGVDDGDDSAPLNANVCRDLDGDSCDDCSSGSDDAANDGLDSDSDGLCDLGDADDDNDGVDDGDDSAPLDANVCRDLDADGCDDCSSGSDDTANDGLDTDSDGQCDVGDGDDDNDGVDDGDDSAPLNANVCRDLDADGCDDCSNGSDDTANDGLDTDSDGLCDVGDGDDDNDGVDDGDDSAPLDANVCRDLDADGCDDCSSGSDDTANDGLDTDLDGQCDVGDGDDDNDGVDDGDDSAPLNANVCRDLDADGCDDCSSGSDDTANDGLDTDSDGACDAGDPDDDNDGVDDGDDSAPLNANVCRDLDADGCDDCSSGSDDTANDGLDTDSDGACDVGDLDDDNDGVDDGDDSAPLNANVCRDLDADGCDDCSSGSDDTANDGLDTDSDGACDVGDGDDDNDGVDDGDDSAPLDANVCRDLDADGCDDCSSGSDDTANDGLDTDLDGQCDVGDPDDDNDGVDDGDDSAPLDANVCRDLDADGCDDCSNGSDDTANDGLDTDSDGACDAGDLDDDNDGVDDGDDSAPLNANVCRDLDADGCDDCSSGSDDTANDGLDTDSDGACDAGDPDDDNDGVDDGDDSAPLDANVCRDLDADGCDDCSSGSDDTANDGLDTDLDGQCDLGDDDDDNDGVDDGDDSAPLNASVCRDLDSDGCDDCSSGSDNTANDGLDTDLDGQCDLGDPDDDNDGTPDGSDCAPLVNSVASPAGDLGSTLRLGPDKSRLSWLASADANAFNVYRGDVASGQPFAYSHACAVTEVAALEGVEGTIPVSGEIVYYLVSPTNVCGGDGGLGQASSGTPRPNDTPCAPQANDAEGDGVIDINDNCPLIGNPGQADSDLDGRGDVCDNCSADANIDQADSDGDLTGDACDSCTDLDGDGFGDPGYAANICVVDNCPSLANASQDDADSDGLGDACDACPADLDNDLDDDGFCGDVDNCPGVYNLSQFDGDGDGLGDACDPCIANDDVGCVACPPGSDPDQDGLCQISSTEVEQFTPMTYRVNTADPGLGQSWYAGSYLPDGGWQAGTFGIGYDNASPPNSADALIDTVIPAGAQSVYTLVDFNVAVAADVERLAIAADYDDGYVAWLNGVEIYRSPEMLPGTVDWDTFVEQREPSNGTTPDFTDRVDVTAAASAALQDGSNRLAIGVWNATASSSDLLLLPQFTVESAVDNCPELANPDQEDADGDGVGNVCDNCPATANFGQGDTDEDGLGDACDPCIEDPDQGCSNCPPGTDPDGDGVCELETVFVEAGDPLIYRANVSDPGLALTWTEEVFTADGEWLPGNYGVGYELASTGPLADDLIATPSAVAPASSIYTRTGFNIPDASAALRIEVAADYDDGYVVWLNGAEIFRSPEMPAGDPAWDADASSHESSNGTEPDYGTLNDVTTAAGAALKNGNNVLAVGVWNSSPTSTDLVVVPRLSIRTTLDNCPTVPNPDQADADGDGLGDACDPG